MKTLKTIVLAISLIFIGQNVMAQPYQNGQKGPYRATMDGWLVNLEEAHALSQKTGKPIMANFTGSDWCGWCKKLKAEVFETAQFKQWAKENVILLELDFPRSFQLPDDIKQQNYQLQQAFGVRGYPTIWFFTLSNDDTGKLNINPLGNTGYVKGGPSAFIQVAANYVTKK